MFHTEKPWGLLGTGRGRRSTSSVTDTNLELWVSVIFQSQTNCGRDGAPDGVELDNPWQLGGLAMDFHILDCQLPEPPFPPPSRSFSFANYGLCGGTTPGVSGWNDGLTGSSASVHYLHRWRQRLREVRRNSGRNAFIAECLSWTEFLVVGLGANGETETKEWCVSF